MPTYATLINVQSLAQQFSEFGFVSLAMALAILSGGIDLSVAAIFAFTDLAALILLLIWGLPLPMVMVCTLAIGAVLGAFNGFFIGYAKARPFLTTMVTLIIVRAIFNRIGRDYATALATGYVDSPVWDFLAYVV